MFAFSPLSVLEPELSDSLDRALFLQELEEPSRMS
jgi:hypothetical protein